MQLLRRANCKTQSEGGKVSCQYCVYTSGRQYKISAEAECLMCKEMNHIIREDSLYLGMVGGFHRFRLHHSRRCPRCQKSLSLVTFECQGGLEVTSEIQQTLIQTSKESEKK